MRRALVVVISGSLALVAGVVFSTRPTAAPQQVRPSALETQSFGMVAKPAVVAVAPTRLRPVPKPRFTRTTYASANLEDSVRLIDACDGPVAINLGPSHPVLVAQHDYCGGSAWMSRLDMGDAVKLAGHGVKSGTYVVTEIRFQIRLKARVSDLPDTDVVLQTCLTEDTKKMVLVGLERFDPTGPV